MQPSIYWLNDLVGCNFACLNVATFAECVTFAVEQLNLKHTLKAEH